MAADEQFVRNLTAYQHRLFGLILSLIPDPEAARDVLQETNVVLWRKADEFEPGTDFGAWAAKVAYLQVMALRSKRSRDRHIFSDDLVGTLAKESLDAPSSSDERTLALEACLEAMPADDQELVRQRYSSGESIEDLAERSGRSSGAVRVALFRLRHALLECIERRLTIQGKD